MTSCAVSAARWCVKSQPARTTSPAAGSYPSPRERCGSGWRPGVAKASTVCCQRCARTVAPGASCLTGCWLARSNCARRAPAGAPPTCSTSWNSSRPSRRSMAFTERPWTVTCCEPASRADTSRPWPCGERRNCTSTALAPFGWATTSMDRWCWVPQASPAPPSSGHSSTTPPATRSPTAGTQAKTWRRCVTPCCGRCWSGGHPRKPTSTAAASTAPASSPGRWRASGPCWCTRGPTTAKAAA